MINPLEDLITITSARARPIPVPPPVTRTVLPLIFIFCYKTLLVIKFLFNKTKTIKNKQHTD